MRKFSRIAATLSKLYVKISALTWVCETKVTYLIYYFSLSNGHQLPNFLPSFRPPKLLGDFYCGRCKRKNCLSHLQSEPWHEYTVPVEVDEALEEVKVTKLNEIVEKKWL